MVQSRSRVTGVGALAVAIGTGVFVLISPAVEREAHMATVRSGETQDFENALRHLCWIRSGVEELDELIPTLELQRRREVLREAVALGCLEQLKPEIRATYYLVDPDGARNLEKAVGYERNAVGPALEALAHPDPEFARRGALVVAALIRRLTESELHQATELVERIPEGSERRLLEHRLDIGPADVEPAPTPQILGPEAEALARDAEEFVPSLRPPELRLNLENNVLFEQQPTPEPGGELPAEVAAPPSPADPNGADDAPVIEPAREADGGEDENDAGIDVDEEVDGG